MTNATRYLASLAQALAKMSLYSVEHPARVRAADASFDQLRLLQEEEPRPSFSFLGREVVFQKRALRELNDWDWAEKLSNAGVQRLEFDGIVDRDEYRAFLNDLVLRVGLGGAGHQGADDRSRRDAPIRFGTIGLREGGELTQGAVTLPQDPDDDSPKEAVDLSDEGDAIGWLLEEVVADRGLRLAEASAVVSGLHAAMHAERQVLLPMLTCRDFDQYSTTHSLNVAVLAMGLAEFMGLSPREVRAYGLAGLLHDIGKVRVPPEVLCKPGTLEPEEREALQRHPVEGARIILAGSANHELCAIVAYEHHIMIDGSGYPKRQRRCDCHHASMLVHVCDVFDALRSYRPYRVAWTVPAALAFIERYQGTQFHPEVARNFMAMLGQWELREAEAQILVQ